MMKLMVVKAAGVELFSVLPSEAHWALPQYPGFGMAIH
jgi:hypothetical protein